MVEAAQSLPVALIPEQDRVAIVFLDVVHLGRGSCPALVLTHEAQWILREEVEPRLAPSAAI